ncbi:hypothetical protein ACGF3G_00575 [Streptomyces sp. NPDC048179]|uniref:hypothetical protein n=1 Tax=Streptomyces sp. NPDC048179 TaxID=3365506 RepID=UPI00371589B4
MTTATATETRTRITDAKKAPKDRTMKRVWLLENLVFHARTSTEERAAAERMLDRAIKTAKEAGQVSTADDGAGVWHGYRLPEVWHGARYEEVKHLSVVEIAKRIRADIKLARKVDDKLAAGAAVAIVDGLAPLASMPKGMKVSVRARHGNAIDVRIYNLPEKGWGYVEQEDPYRPNVTRWVPGVELRGIISALEDLHRQYNFDGSDPMVDYFHVNYYGHVEVDYYERP